MWLTRRPEYRRHLILLALLMLAALYLMQRVPVREARDTAAPPTVNVTQLGPAGGPLPGLAVANPN